MRGLRPRRASLFYNPRMLALTTDQRYYLMATAVLLLPVIPISLYVLTRRRAQRSIPPDGRAAYAGPELAAVELMAQTRGLLGPPRDGRVPRVFERGWPAWLQRSDPIKHVYRAQRALLDHGHVVWAWLVQANKMLFEPGKWDSPAAVVYSDDPSFDASPEELSDVAEALFDLKGRAGAGDDVAYFAEALADEVVRDARLPVPSRLTGGRRVYYATIVVMRAHLPDGVLRRPLVPLLVRPNRTPWAMILPSHYWAPSLVAKWRAEPGMTCDAPRIAPAVWSGALVVQRAPR